MPKPQSVTNPFYMLLVVAGILFVMTACAYFTMALRQARGAEVASHGLMGVMADHGLTILIAELILLAIGTIGAISTDEYWSRRAAQKSGTTNPTDETNAE